MLYEKLLEKFGYNKPIFTNEILELFNEYTKAYVFRLLDREIIDKKILKFDTGVYYIPVETEDGLSLISPEAVAEKRYISNNGEVFGFYSGMCLNNELDLSMQVPNVLEITTNKEATRGREIIIDGQKFRILKSRTPITSKNVDAYKLIEAINDDIVKTTKTDIIKKLKEYIKEYNIQKEDVLDLLQYFPAKTSKKLIQLKLF